MPQLKQLSCCIQWSDTGAPFQEHGTVYGDGVVETFVIVPNKPQGFSIRLTSRGFICEGLVMIVFIDGNYQCNRSRVNLLPPTKSRPTNRTEIDFLLRQKEKSQGDGLYLGREWRFDNHNIVAETPAGFQESHFDDLGVIEVLVLRCRARNREDADYEGSSSGEDSDVFGERPLIEDQEEPSVLPEIAPTTSDPAQKASAVVESPAEEDGGMGFIGLFDGASDPPSPLRYDGSHDAPPGRWIWHQSHPPFAGFPEPPEYHQPEGYRFRSQSYARPPPMAHPQPYHDRRSYSGQPEKKVHFDDPHPTQQQQQQQQQGMHRRSSEIHHPQPQRPVSRVRERWPSKGSQGHPTQPYDPQRIGPSSHDTEWHDISENYDQRQPSRSPYHDDSPYKWGYGNRTAYQNNDGIPSYPEKPNSHRQSQPLKDQGRNTGQQSEQREPFVSGQNISGSLSNANSRPPISATNQGPPGENMAYNAQPIPPSNPAQQSRRSSLYEPVFSAIRPEYPQHAESGNQMPNRSPSSLYEPAFPPHAYPHPHPPPMPHGYHYPQVPYPSYWPVPIPHAYDPSNAQVHPGGPPAIMIHPPHMIPPGFEEQISPTNTHGNRGGHVGLNGGHNYIGAGQEGYGVSRGEQQDASGDGGATQSWQNNSPDNANGTNWNNGNDNAEDETWGHDTNHGDPTGDTNDQEDAANEDQNDNLNTGENNQDNGDWDNKDTSGNAGYDNSGNNDNSWGDENNNSQPANNAGDWDTPAANNSGADIVEHSQSPTAEAGVLSDIPRDLYGPHGPYYALRSIRLGEPRPDAEEEPRFDVPKSLAIARGSTKQVQPGPGYRYYKKSIVPEYIDTLENPYARFVFKYRTKEQLLNEIGIEVDVEPTGDAEIQDLQNLDKQSLIEMLMRAKSALGGKVPSPPPTPSASAQGSEVNVPVAIDAPKHTYLKYNLPPLRPNNINSTKPSPSAARCKSDQKEATPRKEDDLGWDSLNNNSNGGGNWNDTGNNNTTNPGDWGGNGGASGWDGPSVKGVQSAKAFTRSTGSQRSQQGSASGSTQPRQGFRIGNDTPPPRPPTPEGVPPQKDPAEDNWDQANTTSGVQW